MRQKYYIGFCLIVLLTGLTACLKETPLPVKAVFEHQIEGENQTTPVKVSITNASTGADFYEWTFEGGNPADSREKNPGQVVFSEPEIDEYVKQATQFPEREKVMLGKYMKNSPNSYEQIADKEKCTFFEFKRWNEIYSIVGNDDEMWRINKEFILRQKQLNKEFYFSHDPESSKYATGFYKREIDLLKLPKDQGGLGGTIETIIKGKLWKMKF